jgi:quercetin dioxygenase-like cupin family protein
MTIKLVALVLLCLMTGTAIAQEPKVTPLMSKDLPESPGKEALMITVEHAPGGSSAIHRHNAHAFVYVLEGSVVMQVKGLMMCISSTATQAPPSRRNSWCS